MRMPPVVASRLRAADARHFAGNDAYNRVARATCRADAAIARKELPECWAMATRVHAEFWRSAEPPRRVVDVAAGHGLLGWFVLALCCQARTPLPVVYAVDERMPASAGKLRDAFGEAFPRLRAQHRYIVGDARDVEATGDTLVAGLHACGGLSDIVIDVALAGSSALALVPCCHSTKIPHDVDAAARVGLDEAIDASRARRLAAAGWAVERDVLCPREITPKNGLILGRPPPAPVGEARPLYPRSLPPLSFGWRGVVRGS
jgi:hypothetical protein